MRFATINRGYNLIENGSGVALSYSKRIQILDI